MKKFAVLLIAALVAVGSVSAASNPDLVVNATVSPVLYVNVTNTPISITFPDNFNNASTNPSADKNGTLTVISNKKAYKLSFTSTNLGTLKDPAISGVAIPYTLAVSTAAGTTPTGTVLTAVQLTAAKDVTITDGGRTTKTGVDYVLTVAASNQDDSALLYQASTAYTDTITITITATT
ncbi:MAG: hypothetical protein NT061_09370 [Spirochaetes bacterium]|nr:hypothetical protein [Spirochaetota bacterium]